MRWKGILACLMAVLLLSGCSVDTEQAQSADYLLYFLPADLLKGETGHGSALAWEPYLGKEEPSPEDLLNALLAGPESEELASPFPKGVTLRGCSWDEEHPGVLSVSLSEQYGALTAISLTLADYCIVLTLAQLDGLEGVEIHSGEYSSDYRSHQLLKSDEILLKDVFATGYEEDS